MTKDNNTGKNKDFYELGKKMFDRLNPQIAHNPKVVGPEQEPWKCVCGANLYIDENGKPRSKASPPQRQLESTTDMMMELADRLGELPDDIDPRAWEHLLVYAPQRQPLDRNTILNIHAMRNWPRTQFADKGYGIALDTVTVIDFARAIEAALRSKNK